MKQPDQSALPRYPVRLVSSRTGLSPHVLRAWERRYGVIEPLRSEGGQRLYSDLDIQRLDLLRRLTERGHAISRLAKVPLDALRHLEAEGSQASLTGTAPPVGADADASNLREYTESALRWTRRLDHWALQGLLERAAVTLGAAEFLDRVAAPVLDEIGRGWSAGTVSVAQEHLATAVFRRVLGWLLGVYEVNGPAPHLVVATPPGEMHEIGAMMVAVAAAAEGWYVTYLGPDLPVNDLLEAVRAANPTAVALSVVHAPDLDALLASIRLTQAGLPVEMPLLLGGAAAQALPLAAGDAGVVRVESLADLRSLLGRLATTTTVADP